MNKTKYILILMIFAALVFESCKKPHPDEFREPLTEDQLAWIYNKENPKYRCEYLDTNHNIISIDTISSSTWTSYSDYSDLCGDEYTIYYYKANYSFGLGRPELEFDPDAYYLNIIINNQNDFIVELDIINLFNITNINVDTITLNGRYYENVFKFENIDFFKKIFFKKGIGFLYLEQNNGNNATLIENTAKPNRFLKPVRFK